MTARDQLVAWAAGFIDGEGHLSAIERRGSYQLSICASQVKSDEPMKRLQGLFGGNICLVDEKRPPRHDRFQWTLHGAQNVRWALEEMLPMLTVKFREAELLIDLAELIWQRGVPCGPNGVRSGRADEATKARRHQIAGSLLIERGTVVR